ncbi:DNA-binding protein [Patellaria atrata CBS 101060]|uniref:DNA-binding protein n=1 Tax=Patellaria atrata CBS 101060 TaxID=1346257 RepID=A0A9P4SFJ7_9PEZI|nr:DNA-binding protein [Patellaria atrata CBS 101060]
MDTKTTHGTIQSVRPKQSTGTATVQKEGAIAVEQRSSNIAIKQHQSTEVVQTLLNGSISCLSYLRNLFPEFCFDEQGYETSDIHVSYRDFAAGRVLTKKKPGRKGTSFRVLRRGRLESVDMFLNWLEIGAFEALKKNALRALQLSIFEDASNPSQVMESYTFTFSYRKDAQNNNELIGLDMQSSSGEIVTVRTAQHSLQMFVRRIITLCNTLPDLPDSRFLKMHLFYTEDCDPTYEPHGFQPSMNNSILFPQSNEWHKQVQSCGSMDAGFHVVSLKVSHLLNSQPAKRTREEVTCDAIPNDLPYKDKADRQDAIDIEMLDQLTLDEAPTPNTASEDAETCGKTRQEHSEQVTQDDFDANMVDESALISKSPNEAPKESAVIQPPSAQVDSLKDLSDEAQDSTQLTEDLAMREGLRRMLLSSPEPQSLEPTQPLETQTRNLQSEPEREFAGSALRLSQRVLDELNSLKLKRPRRFSPVPSSRMRAVPINCEDKIDCECGSAEEDDDMINCEFCDTWQHLHCYGYRGAKDPRIPKLYACYKCILGKELPLLHEMKSTALLRRGMRILEAHGYNNDRDFAKELKCNAQVAADVASHLRRKGYLVATSGSKHKNFNKRGLPKFHAVLPETDRFSRMLEEYFDPMAKVAHHFDIVENPVLEHTETSRKDTGITASQQITQDVDMDITSPPVDKRASGRTQSQPEINQASKEVTFTSSTPSRYSLRRYEYSKAAPDPKPVTPVRKRNREEKQNTLDKTSGKTPRSKKRFRSSMTKDLVNIGHIPSSSPVPESMRSL